MTGLVVPSKTAGGSDTSSDEGRVGVAFGRLGGERSAAVSGGIVIVPKS